VMLVPLSWSVVRTLLRRDVGVDAIALVAIAAALALGEYLAGAVVALMLAGGNALESAARRRARRELRLLVERAPRIAHRRCSDSVEEVPIEALEVGDVVVVRPGEVVPVDGELASERAVLDESTLTGEPLPVDRSRGDEIRSGTANAGEPFELRASRLASESAYAGIVRLVRAAEEQQAPMVRLADRYAAVFLPVTLVVAGLAWAASGDPVRALAVLVVATPCPLILAAPIALLSGVSRAARRGIVVKGGGVIEQLGRAKTVLFDKTGTITLGDPALERVVPLDGLAPDEILRLAASVDQLSVHALAEALVHDAQRRGLALAYPTQTREAAGLGVEGVVDGRRVAVGSAAWLHSLGYDGRLPEPEGAAGSRILVGVDGHLVGQALVSDPIRDDAHRLVPDLRAAGIRHVALVTGDAAAPAERVGRRLEVDRVYAEQSPEQKLEVVRALQAREELRPVVMVGDGVNDAPALALAEVGIAMGSAGATVSSETADAVISVDRVDRVADAVRIGRRSLGIAEQSVLAGIGLSLVAMAFAAAGFIPPVAGALLQEGIDVAVILNALRALTDG
jgi:heavy metal translocating P-type ATPase